MRVGGLSSVNAPSSFTVNFLDTPVLKRQKRVTSSIGDNYNQLGIFGVVSSSIEELGIFKCRTGTM